MVLTGRAALVAALGAVAVLFTPWPGWALLAVAALVAVLVLVDLLVAGSTRPLTLRRSGPGLVRLGESVDLELLVQNRGRRRVRGVLRDAWPPSAQVQPRHRRVDIAARGQQRLVFTF